MSLHAITKNLIPYVIVISILGLTKQAATEVQARTVQDQSSKITTIMSETADNVDQIDNAKTIDPAYQNSDSYQIFLPIITNDKCAHNIGLKESEADARDKEYSTVSPGDTVCIEGGRRDDLKIKNFRGTPEQPIKFMNVGGQVVIDSNTTHGILIQNSQYFQLTGTGTEDTYGIKIIDSTGSGVRIGWKSEYFEIDHIEVTGVSGSGIAAQTKGVCLDGSDNDYDYDNDGKERYDRDDVVNRDNFTQRNSIFHHNYVYNVGTEGFYIGSSYYGRERTRSCDSGEETIYEPLLREVHLYENLIEESGWDGLQVGSATEACTIHHNRIYRDSQAREDGQESGIMNNPGSVCDIYNNFIKDSGERGIHLQGNGGNKVYNNIIVNPGRNSSASGIKIGSENNNGNLVIINNTIINPSEYGVFYDNKMGDNNIIENNLTVNPGAGIAKAILLESKNGVVASNNFATIDISEVGFVDPDSDDYSLQATSFAIDVGKPQPITIDFNNVPRPQGNGFDIGATEQ